MKIPVLLSALTLSLPPLIAAVPAPPASPACRLVRVGSLQEALSMPLDQVGWGCLDASALSKNDLLALADRAPGFRIRMSESVLNKNDLTEVSRKAFVAVEVDSARVSRNDVIDMQRAGVNLLLPTAALTFNSVDYREIARGGPVTVEVNSRAMTKEQLLEIAREPNLKLVIDGPASGLSSAEIQELLNAAGNVRLRL